MRFSKGISTKGNANSLVDSISNDDNSYAMRDSYTEFCIQS